MGQTDFVNRISVKIATTKVLHRRTVAVAQQNKGPWFESDHRQLLWTYFKRKDINKQKEAGNDRFDKKFDLRQTKFNITQTEIRMKKNCKVIISIS